MKILRIPLVIALVVVAGRAFNAGAQTDTILYSFGDPPDGLEPYAGLVQGSDGNFYGTTYGGGTSQSCGLGCGTVFRISPSGTYMNLYSFAGSHTDGGNPSAGLVQGSDSNFYGTTKWGGTKPGGFGTVFRISPSGSETILYSFGEGGQCFHEDFNCDGSYPEAGLVQGSDGNFYGTTSQGGTSTNYDHGCGTVFRISPGGNYTNLYSFGGEPDGSYPVAGLVQGSDGNFYGTTQFGGTSTNCDGGEFGGEFGTGCGTVFRISTNGSETILYSFGSYPNDGKGPFAGLVQGSDGNFYGTTHDGGTNNLGTVFRISPSGSYTSLYSFGSSPSDGYYPEAGLVQGSDSNFYGTTSAGGGGGDAMRFMRNRISDQSQRHLHEPLLLCRLPHRWIRPTSRAGAGLRRQFLRDDPVRRDERMGHRVQILLVQFQLYAAGLRHPDRRHQCGHYPADRNLPDLSIAI